MFAEGYSYGGFAAYRAMKDAKKRHPWARPLETELGCSGQGDRREADDHSAYEQAAE